MMAKEREEPLNGDGFGLAWYSKKQKGEPALFKSVSPAWSNQNLHELSRVIETTCVMAHVRAATQGFNVSESNCHPFKWKHYAFMHNGDIGGFSKIKRPLLHQLSEEAFQHIKGSTDSEHFFALLIDELIRVEHLEPWDRLPTAMMSAIRKVIALIHEYGGDENSYMNMVLTDGHLAVAVRFTTDDPDYADSLYLNLGKKYVCEDGVCQMKDSGIHEKSVVISSEPLSTDPGWEKVAVNSMVLVEEGKIRDKMEIHMS
jgi:predicted glutamine amidotransferase